MARMIEDNCVGCPPEMGCLGADCPKRNEVVYVCDECGDGIDEVYEVDGEELCESCLKKMFRKAV